jgi:hypothetical protein
VAEQLCAGSNHPPRAERPGSLQLRYIPTTGAVENDWHVLIWRKSWPWRGLSSAEQHEQHEQQVDSFSGKVGAEVSSSSFRRTSSATVSSNLRAMAPSLRSRPRSLSKIRIASSLMMSPRMPTGGDAIFVGDQTRRRMTLKVAPRQRAADRDGLRLPRLNGKDAHDAEN